MYGLNSGIHWNIKPVPRYMITLINFIAEQVFYSGTSRNMLTMTDRRDPHAEVVLRNESMINSMYH